MASELLLNGLVRRQQFSGRFCLVNGSAEARVVTLIYGLLSIVLVVAAVVLRDYRDRWRAPERRGFEVVRKERTSGNVDED
jgi:hypothetical protein